MAERIRCPIRSIYRSTSGLLTNLNCFWASRRNSRLILTSSSSVGGPKEGSDGRLGGTEELQPLITINTERKQAPKMGHRRTLPAPWIILGLYRQRSPFQ